MVLAIGVWCWMAYRYCDLNEINNRLLMEVKQQNDEIRGLIQTCALTNYYLMLMHTVLPPLQTAYSLGQI